MTTSKDMKELKELQEKVKKDWTEADTSVEPSTGFNSINNVVKDLIDSVDIASNVNFNAPDMSGEEQAKVTKEVANFIHKGFFMGLQKSIDYQLDYGQKQLSLSFTQLDGAVRSDTGSNRNQSSQDRLERAIRWYATCEARQLVRVELKKKIDELYQIATGERYVVSTGNSLEQVTADRCTTASQKAAAAILNRRASATG